MGNDQFDLTGKVAIVIGATKGMGAAIADRFAASGARVTINSRTATDASAFANELNQTYEQVDPVAVAAAGDMTDKAPYKGWWTPRLRPSARSPPCLVADDPPMVRLVDCHARR